ncbi:MAG TPA: ferric reductase-like transmembrane domain-containing protein [Candidatus Sulfotelmatobacter sp.]|jgi:DMSO/TMAO reductase YedYZ heme-binding membrane subunit|nr:ferric reductase-like transmembrane domain-containing protein [Candidatus Sulfotelmatobacter sp.]
MKNLFYNSRFYILTGSIALSLTIYLWIFATVSLGLSRIALLVEAYGLISIVYLYFTLLAGPFCYIFRSFPYREQYLKARRALGVITFYFAFLHTAISYFGQLGGFTGFGFLDNDTLIAVVLGFIALFIFFLLAITSFDYAVTKLSFPKWKLLHRFIYLAGILILAHTVMLGPHFATLSPNLSQITFLALVFLLLLEAARFDKYLAKIIPIPQFGISFMLTTVISGIIYFSLINPLTSSSNNGISFDIHAAHKLLAQQTLQQQKIGGIDINKIPGLNGDRNKRYTVSISTIPTNPQPNQDVTIHFTVYDASSGFPASYFRILYAKPMHLIIVNSNLTYFSHIHPIMGDNGEFTITTQFPKADRYHLYSEFQPFGGIEQQVGLTLTVGQTPDTFALSKAQPDTDTIKTFNDYAVSVNTHGTLLASAMSVGAQTISFTIKNAHTGKPITTLKPYLASFGHLTMINEKTFDFLHVHPYSITTPPQNANGGPTVDFLPIGIYGPFRPGIYRAFAEFNPDNNLLTTNFTITVN